MKKFYKNNEDTIDNILVIIVLVLFFWIIIPYIIIRKNEEKIMIFFKRLRRRLIYLKIMKTKKIICKESDIPNTLTRKGFLRQFLTTLPTTYYKNGRVQCKENANRSFTDLLTITQSRFPKTSLANIVRIVAQLNLEKLCILVWCNEVNKFVVVGKGHPDINGKGFFSSYCDSYFKSKVGADGIGYTELVKIRKEQIS